MRTDFSENAISAKVHALYGRRIVRSQYEELCRKHTTSEIAAYLKERTHLTEVLNTVQPATVRSDQLESILHKGRYNKYLDLVRVRPHSQNPGILPQLCTEPGGDPADPADDPAHQHRAYQ